MEIPMSKTKVVMRREGNLSEVIVVEGSLDPILEKMIQNQLTYTHVSQLRGKDAYSRGSYTPFQSEEVALFAYNPQGHLMFPRGFSVRVFNLFKEAGVEIEVTDIQPPCVNPDRYVVDFSRVFAHLDLRAKQDECLAVISASEGGQVVAPTGFGKSFTFGAICLMYPNARIHVITRRRDVMKRLLRHLTKYIPNVGQVGGGSRTWGRVTVITADSLHVVDHTPGNAADIVLYDEVHEAAAPSYSVELAKYQSARMFGFTATPDGRFDGAHHKLEGLFGPKIFEMAYQEAVSHGLVLPVKVEWIDVRMDKNPCEFKKETAKERHGIWRNVHRNMLIAEKANQFSDDDQVLILVRTLEHAVFLKQELPNFKLCYDKMDSEVYNSLIKKEMLNELDEPIMTSSARDQMSRDFEAGILKKVIATDVWSTGVDFPQLSVLIRADARASEIMDVQAPGRVVRRHDESGKDHGLVIDCMDYFDQAFLRRSQERRKTYIRQGWEQALKRVRGSL
jgi:superfamily II DNA or RNA helicase